MKNPQQRNPIAEVKRPSPTETTTLKRIHRLVPAQWSTVFGNILSLTLGSGISQVLMAVTILLSARQLGTQAFGAYASCFTATTLTAVLFNLGLDNWLLRQGTYQAKELNVLLGNTFLVKTVLGIPWIACMAWILPQLNPYTFPQPLALSSAICVWLEGLVNTSYSAFKISLRNQTTAALMIGSRSLLLVTTLLMIQSDLTAVLHYTGIRLTITLLLLLLTTLLLPVRPRIGSLRSAWQTMRCTLSFALSDLLTSVYTQGTATVSAVMLTQDLNGLYASAYRVVSALFIIPAACYSVTVPTLVQVYGDRKKHLGAAFGTTAILFALVGAILLGVVWLISGLLPMLLGSSFAGTEHILIRLGPVILLKSLSFAAVAILVVVGWQKWRVSVQAVVAIVNLGLSTVLAGRFAIDGLTAAYAISEGLLLTGYMGIVLIWLWRSAIVRRKGLDESDHFLSPSIHL